MTKEIKKVKVKVLKSRFECLDHPEWDIMVIDLFKNDNKHSFNWIDRHNRPKFDLYCKYITNNCLNELLTQINCDYHYIGHFNAIEIVSETM